MVSMVKATAHYGIESTKDTSERGVTYSNLSSLTDPSMRRWFPCHFIFATLTVLVWQFADCYTTLARTYCIKRQCKSSVSEGREDKSASQVDLMLALHLTTSSVRSYLVLSSYPSTLVHG